MTQLFKVEVLPPEGGVYELLISAETQESAQSLAESQGRVIKIAAEKSWIPEKPLSSEEREQMLSQLAFLIGSGMGTGAALRTIQEHTSGRMQETAAELYEAIEQGYSLSSALGATSKKDFPTSIQAIVSAGEQTGKGSEALQSASDFESELRTLSKSNNGSLIAAAFGFAGAAVSLVASVYYVGPMVLNSSLVTAAGDDVSVGWAIWLSYILMSIMVVLSFFGLAVSINHFIVRRYAPLVADALTMRLPLVRDALLGKEQYLCMHSISALLSQEIEIEKALLSSLEGISEGACKQEVLEASESVRQGQPWVNSLISLPAIDKAALRGASNRTQLSQIFGKIALRHKERYGSSRTSLALILQTIAAVSLVGAGGVLFALSTLPILQSSNSTF